MGFDLHGLEDECCEECTYWNKEEGNKEMKKIQISEEEFVAYEAVRQLGYFNMFDSAARESSGLDVETYNEIIDNYDVYHKMYIKEKEINNGDKKLNNIY